MDNYYLGYLLLAFRLNSKFNWLLDYNENMTNYNKLKRYPRRYSINKCNIIIN